MFDRCLSNLTRTKKILASLIFACFLFSVRGFAAPLETKLLEIPIQVDDTQFILDAKVYKPVGKGPFPLIVLTHGAPRTKTPEHFALYDVDTYYESQSEFLASQGYAVVFVERRGFGRSKAPFANGRDDYYKAGMESAKDLSTAIQFMKTEEYINPRDIVLLGKSAGGFAVLATGSLAIDGVRGIVNVSGGRGSDKTDHVLNPDQVIDCMAAFGKTSRVPSLWLYSLNDHYFGPKLVQEFYNAYTGSGGQAKLIFLPASGKDGHEIFEENRDAWAPHVLQFLKTITQN